MQVTGRERKFIIIGVIAVLAIAVFYFVSGPSPVKQEASLSVEQQRRALLQSREILAQEPVYRARAEQYRERLQQLRATFLQGDNASIAGAELQRVLKELADQSGVDIVRRTIRGEQKLQNGVVKVSVNIETNCQPDQLVRFLAAIENYEKHLSVDELQINSFRIQKRYEMRPILTVSGYILVPETKAEAKTAG
ncbi:MAG: Type secretion system protein subtype b [Acidobacteria bacterium]|nr:Type secretion system protein subtype b [Acidobacteriota bacterium]